LAKKRNFFKIKWRNLKILRVFALSLAKTFFFVYLMKMVTTTRHTQKPLISAPETAREMARLSVKYSSDLGDMAKWPLEKFYKFVKDLPFRSDPQGHESIARPSLTLGKDWPWRDCDDKSILIGAWCFANKIPFKFQASSKHPSGHLHHVYVIAKIDKMPFVIDATYPRNTLGIMDKGITKIQNLTGDIMDSTLNIFEGDADPLLGWSFRKLAKKYGKVAAAGAIGGPVGIAAYKVYQHKQAGKHGHHKVAVKNRPVTLHGPAELMGKSFLKRMAKKAGKVAKKASSPVRLVTHAVLRTPGLKDALAATIPGASAALAAARRANKTYKSFAPAKSPVSMTDSFVPPLPEEKGMDKKKMLMIGGGVVAVALVAFVALKKKRG